MLNRKLSPLERTQSALNPVPDLSPSPLPSPSADPSWYSWTIFQPRLSPLQTSIPPSVPAFLCSSEERSYRKGSFHVPPPSYGPSPTSPPPISIAKDREGRKRKRRIGSAYGNSYVGHYDVLQRSRNCVRERSVGRLKVPPIKTGCKAINIRRLLYDLLYFLVWRRRRWFFRRRRSWFLGRRLSRR